MLIYLHSTFESPAHWLLLQQRQHSKSSASDVLLLVGFLGWESRPPGIGSGEGVEGRPGPNKFGGFSRRRRTRATMKKWKRSCLRGSAWERLHGLPKQGGSRCALDERLSGRLGREKAKELPNDWPVNGVRKGFQSPNGNVTHTRLVEKVAVPFIFNVLLTLSTTICNAFPGSRFAFSHTGANMNGANDKKRNEGKTFGKCWTTFEQ